MSVSFYSKSASPKSATGNPFDDRYGKGETEAPWWSPVYWYQFVILCLSIVQLFASIAFVIQLLPKSWQGEANARLIASIKAIIKELLYWLFIFVLKIAICVLALGMGVLLYKYYDHIIAELLHDFIYHSLPRK
jgi:hypothetical protein